MFGRLTSFILGLQSLKTGLYPDGSINAEKTEQFSSHNEDKK